MNGRLDTERQVLYPRGMLVPTSNGTPPPTESLYDRIVTSEQRRERLHRVLGILRSNKWIIVGSFILATGLAALYLFYTPDVYQASSILQIKMNAPGPFGRDVEPGRMERNLANEMVLLEQSFPIALRVAQRLRDLSDDAEMVEALSITYDEDGALLDATAIAFRLRREYLTIERLGDNVDMINVVATSAKPTEAARIANVYSEEYIQRTMEASRLEFSASRTFLERQESNLRQELEAVEQRLERYMNANNAVALDDKAANMVTQMAAIEAARDEVRVEIEMKEASLASTRERLAEIEPRLASSLASTTREDLRQAQERIAEREMSLERIFLRNPKLRSTPSSSEDVNRLRGEIETLQAKVERLSKQYVDEMVAVAPEGESMYESALIHTANLQEQIARAEIELSGLRAKYDALDVRLAGYGDMMQRMPKQSIELAQLQRARQSKERLYVDLVGKLQEARVNEESELGYAEVVRPAFVPTEPIGPNGPRTLFLAAIAGLCLGIGLSIVRSLFDVRVKQIDDLRERGQNVIGAIPDMTEFVKERFDGNRRTRIDDRTVSTLLVMLLEPGSPEADAWRRLRTNIQFSPIHPHPQMMLITSPSPGEGKSIVTANLGIAMALSGRRTVIVDADMRRPKMHRLFGSWRGPGLSHVISDPYYFDDEFFSTGVENLYLIPAGSTVPNPSEMLEPGSIQRLVQHLRESFDVVLIDGPPVLPFSDALVLSASCDGAVVVARAGRTQSRDVMTAVDLLQTVGTTILGSVINGLSLEECYDSRSYSGGHYLPYTVLESDREKPEPVVTHLLPA